MFPNGWFGLIIVLQNVVHAPAGRAVGESGGTRASTPTPRQSPAEDLSRFRADLAGSIGASRYGRRRWRLSQQLVYIIPPV